MTVTHGGVVLAEQFLWRVEYQLSGEKEVRVVHIATEEFSHESARIKWADKYNCTIEISYAGPVLV